MFELNRSVKVSGLKMFPETGPYSIFWEGTMVVKVISETYICFWTYIFSRNSALLYILGRDNDCQDD